MFCQSEFYRGHRVVKEMDISLSLHLLLLSLTSSVSTVVPLPTLESLHTEIGERHKAMLQRQGV